MVFTRRYRDLGTTIDGLYRDIRRELQQNKDLSITSERKGEVKGIPFMSITASRATLPRVLTGTLREVTITMTGTPDDWLIEVHTGAWFANMMIPSAGGLLLAGPVGATVGAGATAVFARVYARKLKDRIKELVKKHSIADYHDNNVETYIELI